MARYICILNDILIWFVTITMISCLPTRTRLQRVFLDDKTTLEDFFISSELTLLPDRLGFIWVSTQDKFLRKFNYPHKYRYGLEFNLKHKSLHLVMHVHSSCWRYRYKSRSEYIEQTADRQLFK